MIPVDGRKSLVLYQILRNRSALLFSNSLKPAKLARNDYDVLVLYSHVMREDLSGELINVNRVPSPHLHQPVNTNNLVHPVHVHSSYRLYVSDASDIVRAASNILHVRQSVRVKCTCKPRITWYPNFQLFRALPNISSTRYQAFLYDSPT